MATHVISAETWALRQHVLQKYGGHCTCPCGCVDTNPRRLQFDHVDGFGTQERKTVRGNKLYQKLLRDPVDGTFRLLCAGCHFEHTLHGGCLGAESTGYDIIEDEVTPGAPLPRQPEEVREVSAAAAVSMTYEHLSPAGIMAAERPVPRPMVHAAPRRPWLRRGWGWLWTS